MDRTEELTEIAQTMIEYIGSVNKPILFDAGKEAKTFMRLWIWRQCGVDASGCCFSGIDRGTVIVLVRLNNGQMILVETNHEYMDKYPEIVSAEDLLNRFEISSGALDQIYSDFTAMLA